jgi:predicted phosphodiesterase
MLAPGRSCPTSYRYGARALAGVASLHLETLWIAGGLYGNPFALDALLGAYAADRSAKALVFNGDFHWFDVEPAAFQRINDAVLGFHATRGNVETELATPQEGAGCGCGYPDWVGDDTVARSNWIFERLRDTARRAPQALRALGALPMYLVARVGDTRIGVVHGDADSLAGWNFSQEVLTTEEGLRNARAAFDTASVDVFASSHTCLPVVQRFRDGRVIVNNGAAGMPNFRNERCGVVTRIALTPARESLYGVRCGRVYIDALALHYDHAAWLRRFEQQWPPGSDAHASYYRRIVAGPDYSRESALRSDLARVPSPN